MKGKTNLALAVFYFSLFFSISCEENSPELEPEPVEANNHQAFSLDMFDGAIQENLSFQYNNFVEVGLRKESSAAHRTSDKSKEKWIEYKSRFKGHILIEDSRSSRNIFFTLLKHVRGNEPPIFILLKFVPSIELDNSKEYAYFNLQNFSGTIYTYNEEGEMGYVVGVTDGRVQDMVRAGENKGRNNPGGRVLNIFPPPDECDVDINVNCGGGGGGGGSWQWEIYNDYTDWWQVITVGYVTYPPLYIGSDYFLKTRNVWVPDNTPPSTVVPHEHISAGNGGYSTSSPHSYEYLKSKAEAWEDQIDDSQLEPCMQSILNDLTNLTVGVGQIVQKFATNTEGYNWKTVDGSLTPGGTGSTDPPALYNSTTSTITTTFDSQQYLQATDLSWARTILHEAVHADLAVYFAIDRPAWVATYPQMVEEWGDLQNWNDVHHEEMARSLVNDISIALQQYGINKGYNLSKQFYDDMAWGGLQETSAFTDLSNNDQTRILNTSSIELTGKDLDEDDQSQKGTNAGC